MLAQEQFAGLDDQGEQCSEDRGYPADRRAPADSRAFCQRDQHSRWRVHRDLHNSAFQCPLLGHKVEVVKGHPLHRREARDRFGDCVQAGPEPSIYKQERAQIHHQACA